MKSNLVVHVPHASLHIPDDAWEQFSISQAHVDAEAKASADLHTDVLALYAWHQAKIICAAVSRIVVDVERYSADNQEEMAEVGRGIIYTHDHRGNPIRTRPVQSIRSDLLSRYYIPHWRNLREAAAGATLVDLHTYPAEPWPIEKHLSGQRPEIDIGFSETLSPMGWVENLTDHFRAAGYSVGHNTPYAGVIDAGAQAAVMIEIRRDVVGRPRRSEAWTRLVNALSTMPLPTL